METKDTKAIKAIKQVAIIGADCVSVSIALGLKARTEPPKIVGYDADPLAAKLARSKQAFDRVERQPDRACRDADLVIVAVPLPAVRETLAAIAPRLKPGCLVTDIARLKTPVMRWAEEVLPENVCFVGGHPVLSPATACSTSADDIAAASADLLHEALYCLTTPAGCPGAVIDTLAGLIKSLGAHPFFIDVTEHDGLQAGVEGLPDLLAVALLRATVDTPGWTEMRKFGGYRFAATTVAADDASERHAAVLLNRENVLRRLNVLLGELVHLRDQLTRSDADGLKTSFVQAAEARARWVEELERGTWMKELGAGMEHVPSAGDHFRQMMLGDFMTPRRPGGEDRSRQK